jgi:hypothetical protein
MDIIKETLFYVKYIKISKLGIQGKIVFAGADQILGEQKAPNNVQSFTISNADHDFSSESRKQLLNLIVDLI